MGSDGSGGRRRLGVTGHRSMAHIEDVAVAIDALLDRLSDGATRPLTCISSLAEGADRLVAQRVLARPGGRLEVPLPLEPIDYADDFATEPSRRAFNDLLAAADEVQVIPTRPDDDGSRAAAYERAGLAMLDRVDVLVALWDGRASRGRGGTAEVVEAARRRGIPVEIVPVERGVGGSASS